MSPYNRQNATLDLIHAAKLRSQRVENNKFDVELAEQGICHDFRGVAEV